MRRNRNRRIWRIRRCWSRAGSGSGGVGGGSRAGVELKEFIYFLNESATHMVRTRAMKGKERDLKKNKENTPF